MVTWVILMFGDPSAVLSAISWLALLFAASSSGWIIWSAAKKHMKKSATPNPPMFPPATFPMPEVRRRGKATVWISSMTLILGVGIGYGSRDLQQFHHTYVLNDVQVLRRDSHELYLMQTSAHQPFEMKFCPDYTPDLDEGSLLKVIVYEDRGECKSVSDKKLGYIVARDEHGKTIIQKGN